MDDYIKTLENLITYSSKRHGVLLSNIANVDTPNYKVKDLIFPKLVEEEGVKLIVTHEKHISNENTKELKEEVVEMQNENWDDKNNVEIDKEVAKMTENSILYQSGLQLLSSRIRMFKNALRRS
ncbi:MAG: flagellar basal body rod protein FlgB [bacterium]